MTRRARIYWLIFSLLTGFALMGVLNAIAAETEVRPYNWVAAGLALVFLLMALQADQVEQNLARVRARRR